MIYNLRRVANIVFGKIPTYIKAKEIVPCDALCSINSGPVLYLAAIRHVPGTGFSNGASTLKQHFVLPKNGSKYYLKYTFLVFPVLGIFGLGTSLAAM